jgi:hypothetical protein
MGGIKTDTTEEKQKDNVVRFHDDPPFKTRRNSKFLVRYSKF